ncbi:MAG: CHASE2 domain-containing protein, partial [Chloroflexota bacterium]
MVLLPFNSRYARLWIGMATGVLVALLMVGLWSQNYFVRTRLRMTNLYYVAQQASDNVVIVAIDDRSIREYGAYQDWSRERYAALLDQLSAGNARVAAFDLLFSEPRDGDAALAAAITDAEAAGTRVVLAAAGFERLDEADGALHFAD